MFRLQQRKYYDWILSAAVGASLVVLIHYGASPKPLASSDLWGASMFVATIPFALASLFISKEAELHKRNDLGSVDLAHSLLFLLAILFFLLGFIIFVHNISVILSVTLSVAGIISVFIYSSVRKEIIAQKKS